VRRQAKTHEQPRNTNNLLKALIHLCNRTTNSRSPPIIIITLTIHSEQK
jgi:hypothetical protein